MCRYATFIYTMKTGFNLFRYSHAKTSRSLARHCPLEYVPMSLSRQTTSEARSGRGARIRTGDFLVPNQTRYQAALRPDTNQ